MQSVQEALPSWAWLFQGRQVLEGKEGTGPFPLPHATSFPTPRHLFILSKGGGLTSGQGLQAGQEGLREEMLKLGVTGEEGGHVCHMEPGCGQVASWPPSPVFSSCLIKLPNMIPLSSHLLAPTPVINFCPWV